MARTLPVIVANIKTTYVNLREAAGLPFDDPTLWSVVNIKRLLVYMFASGAFILETLWDCFKADVNQALSNDKSHTLNWYASMAMQFQLGSELVTDEDYYDNSSLTSDQVAAQQIIANAAAIDTGNEIVLKVVKSNGTDYIPLDPDAEVPPFTAFMAEIQDAGIKPIVVLSMNPDHIQATVNIYYDPTILNADGSRVDGTDATPVQDAFSAYLFSINFKSGRYFRSKQFAQLMAVPGVIDCQIVSVAMQEDGTTNWTAVNMEYDATAGFIRAYNTGDLTLNFTPYQP